jgi:hypothetical protein
MKPQSNCPLNGKTPLEHTVATRVTFEELSDIRAAASACGVSSSHWLRSAALAHLNLDGASHRTPLESAVLAEVMCLRTILVNLVAQPGYGLPTSTVNFVIAHAESVKHSEVAKLLARSKGGLDSIPSRPTAKS